MNTLILTSVKKADRAHITVPSLLHAYRNQLCLNEKDHGPKAFVANNPLFQHFKEAQSTSWDKAQDRLMEIVKKQARADAEAVARGEQQQPPAYSYSSSRSLAPLSATSRVSMAAYNNPHNPCFAGASPILLASGRRIPVRLLRRGAAVLTPAGPRRVAAVVETALRGVALCELGEALSITPWHPVFDARSAAWVFPATVADASCVVVRRRGVVKVYSVMLEEGRERRPEAHAVDVGGYWCVTLGHGMVERVVGDARGHAFFGDYAEVMGELKRLPKGKGGVLRCGGVRRDEVTGLACGFEKPAKGRNDKVRRRYSGCQKISAILP